MNKNVVSPLQKTLKRLSFWTVILYVILATFMTVTYALRTIDLNRVERNSDRNTAAFCALSADLERRVKTSKDFLEENPGGIPGISAETIRTSIQNMKATIRALNVVDCSQLTG
jgi:hypothetical protein